MISDPDEIYFQVEHLKKRLQELYHSLVINDEGEIVSFADYSDTRL